jgi:rhodanese-related sulfurtransferase
VGVSEDDSAIARTLAEVQARLDRVDARDLADEVAAGAVLVDIRPSENRAAEGSMPGAIVIERIHLEWRLDPTSPDRIDIATADLRVILVCNEGYSSSLAADSLRRLGVTRATDLIGGYSAWKERQAGAVSDP